jgi:hypothetical protein
MTGFNSLRAPTLFASAFALVIALGGAPAQAVNCNKNPNHRDCGGDSGRAEQIELQVELFDPPTPGPDAAVLGDGNGALGEENVYVHGEDGVKATVRSNEPFRFWSGDKKTRQLFIDLGPVDSLSFPCPFAPAQLKGRCSGLAPAQLNAHFVDIGGNDAQILMDMVEGDQGVVWPVFIESNWQSFNVNFVAIHERKGNKGGWWHLVFDDTLGYCPGDVANAPMTVERTADGWILSTGADGLPACLASNEEVNDGPPAGLGRILGNVYLEYELKCLDACP